MTGERPQPLPGDAEVVTAVAASMGAVADDVDELVRQLRTLSCDTGPTIWSGSAADRFQRLLAEAEPDLVTLSTSFDTADRALRSYADALREAQRQAGDAVHAADAADADRAAAQQRATAAAQRASAMTGAAAADDQELRTLPIPALMWPTDPVAQAQVEQRKVALQQRRDQARAAADSARDEHRRAESDASDAATRYAAACVLGRQAAQARDGAARTASAALDDASRSVVRERNVFQRAFERVDDWARDLTASPRFTSWLNMFSDAGDVLVGLGTMLSFIPGLQTAGGVLLAAGVTFKGISFAGTLLANRYGRASGSQVFASGLDLVLSMSPGGKPATAMGKAMGKVVPKGLVTRAAGASRSVSRTLRLPPAGAAGPVDESIATMLRVEPEQYFRAAERTRDFGQYTGGGFAFTTGVATVSADISRYSDPREPDSLGDVLPDAGGDLVAGAGRLSRAPLSGEAAEYVVDAIVEAGENNSSWTEESRR